MDRPHLRPECEKGLDPDRDLRVRFSRGIAIPDGMLSPGQDGYRTPTIEDYESHESHHKHRAQRGAHVSQSHLSSPGGVLSIFSETKIHLRQSLEKLSYKQRLRHFTWTFFTMTMATGGIANVLHAGTCYQWPVV